MISRAVALSARHPWIVIVAAVVLAVGGELGRRGLSRDAIPELADPQIALVAEWMGHPAEEVASAVTAVLTRALEGVPGSTAVRGLSMTGMAYVNVVFASRPGLDDGRRAVVARVADAKQRLPKFVRVQVGPAASSTGWIFQYALIDRTERETSALEMRRLQEDVLRPALASIPGVAEIASVGGHGQQVLIEAKAETMREKGIAFTDLLSSVRSAMDTHAPSNIHDLENCRISAPGVSGEPSRFSDVARARIDDEMPGGLADLGGTWAAIGGIVVARGDADPASVIARVKQVLERERAKLRLGIDIVTVYDRSELANRVDRAMIRALAQEVAIVVLVIAAFLLHGRSALVPLITLPVVLLLTFGSMWLLHVPATIMSLGGIGIALGMAIDADVVALEACHRRLESLPPDSEARRTALLAAGLSFAPAILTSLMITALAFLPVFAFTGETGRLLYPLALTKTLVIASAGVVTLTLAPALRDRLLRGRVTPEFQNPLTRHLVSLYRPFVTFALRHPVLALFTAALAVASSIPIAARLGGEFLPRLDEGDLLFMPTTLPSVTAENVDREIRRQDRVLAKFAEIDTVFAKAGRADTATDPAPISMAETTIRLRPRSEWPKLPRARWYSGWAPSFAKGALGLVWPEQTEETMSELVQKLDRATQFAGWTNAWTAPARARMDMMSTGIRTPVGIRVVASSPRRLDELGTAVRTLAEQMPGVRSAAFESLGGEPRLRFDVDPAEVARHGVEPALVDSTVDLLLTGGQIGEIEKDGRRLRVRIAPDLRLRGPEDQLRDVTVRAAGPQGEPVPLALLGRPRFANVPTTVRTERGEPVAYVYVDLGEGTDPVGYVGRARKAIDRAVAAGELRLESGERIEWTGQYELFAAGARRLRWIVPIMALSMLGLLVLQFRSLTEAIIVAFSIPFALVGSFWSLFLMGYPLSAPVWVGLLSVAGLAMQTGVVTVVYMDESLHRHVREGKVRSRDDIVAAHAEGTIKRLRPKLMTVTTMGMGLLPLLWGEGAGAEVMRRVATPMVGGLLTSTFLTLEVLPVIYTIWRYRQLRRALRAGVSMASIIGPVPAWARGDATSVDGTRRVRPTST